MVADCYFDMHKVIKLPHYTKYLALHGNYMIAMDCIGETFNTRLNVLALASTTPVIQSTVKLLDSFKPFKGFC